MVIKLLFFVLGTVGVNGVGRKFFIKERWGWNIIRDNYSI